jgi:hypothetical protein
MKRFSTGVLAVYASVFVITLFSFKINILQIGGSGIRLDDFLLFLSLPFFIFIFDRFELRAEFKYFYIFIFFSLFSLFLGVFFSRISFLEGALYWVRNIQYMCFFLFGMILAPYINLDRVFRYYILYVLIFLVLQYFSLVPTFSLFSGSGRAVANTSGPYELAVVVSLTALFFWFQSPRKIFVVLSVIILFLTQSRITLVALILIFFIKAFKIRGRLVFFGICCTAIIFLSFSNLGVIDRFLLLFDKNTLETFSHIFDGIPHFDNTWTYRNWAFVDYVDVLADTAGDKSTYIRLIRQYSLFQSVKECGYSCMLFGLGPSFASAAVDGNLVRLLVEYGVVGTFLFIFGVWKVVVATNNSTVKYYFVLLLITAIAIDILVSSKAMFLLWFLCGYYCQKNRFFPAEAAISTSILLAKPESE